MASRALAGVVRSQGIVGGARGGAGGGTGTVTGTGTGTGSGGTSGTRSGSGGGGGTGVPELLAAVAAYTLIHAASPAAAAQSVSGPHSQLCGDCARGVLRVVRAALCHTCGRAEGGTGAGASGGGGLCGGGAAGAGIGADAGAGATCDGCAAASLLPPCVAWLKSALRSPAVQRAAVQAGALETMVQVATLCAGDVGAKGAPTLAAPPTTPFTYTVGCDALKAANNLLVVVPGALDELAASSRQHAGLVRLLQCRPRCHPTFLTTLCRVTERSVASSPAFAHLLLHCDGAPGVVTGLVSALADCVRRPAPPFPRGGGRLECTRALLDVLFAMAGESGLVAGGVGVAALPAALEEPVSQLVLIVLEVRGGVAW